MPNTGLSHYVPHFDGVNPATLSLPVLAEYWQLDVKHSGNLLRTKTIENKVDLSQHQSWKWPSKPLYFISDAHADAEAFIGSLVTTGTVVKTGDGATDFMVKPSAKHATFIIGGDCLDKGPSNLALLDAVQHLRQSQVKVKLLAGNHDMRLLMGLQSLRSKRNVLTDHLFVRMGNKVVPLLKEVYQTYVQHTPLLNSIPDIDECRARLFPKADWFQKFPLAATQLSAGSIERELERMQNKVASFEKNCLKAGLTLRDVYATALKCQDLFLEPEGHYAWFFDSMKLIYRKGAFLFLHAGVDDTICEEIKNVGIKDINQQFKQLIKQDLFTFYYGTLANSLRTKYRPVDLPLTENGVKTFKQQGLHVVVHGHKNRKQGQRIVNQHGIMHIEADITLDRNSRKKKA
ncbi:metallophosphoesterase [Paraglaciecola aquimarina]|uniref:Metallophosphoesterase n=1 Tax=Paraglaciecola aquimarina TaxID=1235557 RepID=A0ABU3T0P4_9ALTE|nr:metallophosphoesterase [Paraglaciecola aquimarina]MDU0355846.1 metallophosphoesterase [Paraglaciecola aquimarina]